jgi:hypothetical protein
MCSTSTNVRVGPRAKLSGFLRVVQGPALSHAVRGGYMRTGSKGDDGVENVRLTIFARRQDAVFLEA